MSQAPDVGRSFGVRVPPTLESYAIPGKLSAERFDPVPTVGELLRVGAKLLVQ